MENVGFIGLGNMGGGISANLQKAGYSLTVYDIREGIANSLVAGGARLGKSPADVAESSDVIFTSLPGPAEVEQVALGRDGLHQGIGADRVYVDLSSSRPTLIRKIAAEFQKKGAHVLDAPLSGGKSGAESGNLTVMVGGDPTIFERIKPLLDTIGNNVFYTGGVGAGSICKLVHNMIGHSVRQAVAEGLTLGVKAGVEPEVLWECVRRGVVGRMRFLHEGVPRSVFHARYEPASFALKLAHKDIALATELAREYSVPMPMTSLAEQIAIQAMNRGWGDRDHNVTVLLQEECADVEVRAPHLGPDRATQMTLKFPE